MMNLKSETCPYCGFKVFSVAMHMFKCPKMLEAVAEAEAEAGIKKNSGDMSVSFTLISSGRHAVDISCDGGTTWIPLGIVVGPGPVTLGPFPAPSETATIAMRVVAETDAPIVTQPAPKQIEFSFPDTPTTIQ